MALRPQLCSESTEVSQVWVRRTFCEEDRPKIEEVGVIELTTSLDLEDRLVELASEMSDIIKQHNPTIAALEGVFSHGKFPRSALILDTQGAYACLNAADWYVHLNHCTGRNEKSDCWFWTGHKASGAASRRSVVRSEKAS